jgi:adenylate cyclase
MTEKRVQRRLAAILAADIVGYSRLMERDEASTLAALKARRQDVLTPLVAQHNGRVVKVMGDGVLVEFGSAVDAVQCAVELQRGFAEANEGMAEARHINLRIGINLGDVIVEGGDLYGDGVNVAARLEGLAEPGGIYVSSTVYDHVIGKLTLAFDDIGESNLKNIQKPVRIYRAKLQAQIAIEPETRDPAVRASIAILPFANLGSDPAQGYFSDGIAEDIITGLARFRHLDVVARNSSFRYRGDVDIRKAGQELDARYLVEGSVRRMGERLRITAQLIETLTCKHVWADSFDVPGAELFDVQDQVVQQIVATLVGRVNDAGVRHARLKPPQSLAAYELVQRANALNWESRDAKGEARQMLENALRLDPEYATAHSLLSAITLRDAAYHTQLNREVLDISLSHASKAVEIDDNDSACQSILGWVLLARGEFDLANEHIDRALQLNPNNPYAMINRGSFLNQTGRPDEAISWFEKVQRSDPYFNPSWCREKLGFAHFTARRYEKALDQLSRASKRRFYMHALEAACQAMLGKIPAAKTALKRTLEQRPDCNVEIVVSLLPYSLAEDRKHLEDALAMAGFLHTKSTKNI